jgi:hypothetical protein
MLVPGGDIFACWSAHHIDPPPLMPQKMPSLFASAIDVAMASSDDTCDKAFTIFSSTAAVTNPGMKSVDHPCSRWGRHTGWGRLNVVSSPFDASPYSCLTPKARARHGRKIKSAVVC